jgi:hypothetical protein
VLSGGAPVAGHGGQRWHDARRSRGGEWVEEEERKEELLRWCAPLKAARGGGRWRRGGRNSGRETAAAKPWAWARWQPPLSKGGRRGLGAVRAVRLTLGANAVLYFPRIIQTGSNLKIGALHAPKIPNFCMWLVWDIINIFLNCVNIQFPT